MKSMKKKVFHNKELFMIFMVNIISCESKSLLSKINL